MVPLMMKAQMTPTWNDLDNRQSRWINVLARLKPGVSRAQALDSLVKADAHNEGRQVAMVDARGTVAAYTGAKCIPEAGHLIGDQFSVQANLMANATVWPAMKEAFEKSQGDLAERMMRALEAAQLAPDTEAEEVFVVLSGRATIRFLSPALPSLEVGPGSIVHLAEGMQTEWTVTETLRKVYVV